ncbi:MAG: pentapeptide repeat-containing protein [candidate division NC10 bacterium]|nr:pentapeptide repeat-containing protein [candidate division NC10 bacterium]
MDLRKGVLILTRALVGLLLIAAAPPVHEQETKPSTCEGKYKGGKRVTPKELSRILEDHSKWRETLQKKGRKANLCGADLSGANLGRADLSKANLRKAFLGRANLSRADLSEADLRGAFLGETNLGRADLTGADLRKAILEGADLTGARLLVANLGRANLSKAFLGRANLSRANLRRADLRGANLSGANLRETDLERANLRGALLLRRANLREANLRRANLRGANLRRADLRGADLRGANLRGASLRETNLRGADLRGADFSSTLFEPKEIDLHRLIGAKGLSSIQFVDGEAVVQLKKALKEAGLRREERALTAAIRKYRLKEEPAYVQLFESFVLGGKLTDYGAKPWGCVVMFIAFIPLFSIPYMLAVKGRGRSGIWATLPEDRVHKGRRNPKPIRLTTNFPGARARSSSKPPRGLFAFREREPFARWLRVLRIGLYFSLLSAFRIGWRELTVGNWITRLQSREYILRATGWVRTISGLQSLISIYLIALWILTYFGRPFE